MLIQRTIRTIRAWMMSRECATLSLTIETTEQQKTETFFAELAEITQQTKRLCHQLGGEVIGHIELNRQQSRRGLTPPVTLHRIRTVFPNRGRGSKILRQICNLADRHGIFIEMKIAPLDRKPRRIPSAESLQSNHLRGAKQLIPTAK